MTANLSSLVSDNLDIWTAAPEKSAGSGRVRARNGSFFGTDRLRDLILELAVRGRLVRQDPFDEPASALLAQIESERQGSAKVRGKSPSLPRAVVHEPFELPATWLWLPLGQTGNIFSGTSVNASTRLTLASNDDGVPFVATKDVGYGLDPIDYETGLLVSREDARFKIARRRSVFICAEGGSAGRKIALSDREIAFGNKLIANETWRSIDPEFALYVYMSPSFFDFFSNQMTGIIGGIALRRFMGLPFPLPPLAEQRRITAKVGALMRMCDALERESIAASATHQTLVETLLGELGNRSGETGRVAEAWSSLRGHFDDLFTTEESADALKDAITGLAVAGRLVPKNAGDSSAEEAVRKAASAKQILFQQEGLRSRTPVTMAQLACSEDAFPAHWQITSFDSIFVIVSGVTKGQKVQRGEAVEAPYLRVANVQRGWLDLTEVKNLVVNKLERHRYLLRAGDLLMTEGGDWDKLGRGAIWREEVPECIHQNHIFRLRFNQQAIVPEWVELFVNSWIGREYFSRSAKQTTNLASINMTQLRSCPIPIPPFPEQQRIVAKARLLLARCDTLKAYMADAAKTQRDLADAIIEKAAA